MLSKTGFNVLLVEKKAHKVRSIKR